MSVASVDLLWQQRLRAVLPASGHNLGADGSAWFIKPDEFERRTYQVVSISTAGEISERCALAVETVHKFDLSPDRGLVLGMTAEDLYLFRDGRKVRFTPDRRVLYTDACLATDSGVFVTASSDSLFAAHAVTLGDASGRLHWSKDFPTPINRVAVTAAGDVLTVGLQDGRILALDARKQMLWECIQEEPVSALAMSHSGRRAVAGTEFGTVLALDGEGGLDWRAVVGLPVSAVAADATISCIAAAASDGLTHLVTCFGDGGAPLWEHELEAPPTGIALASDGSYLLVTAANGLAWLFALEFAPNGAPCGPAALEAARAARAEGDLPRARAVLIRALEETPHHVEAAHELQAVEQELVERLRAEARSLAAESLWGEAFTHLAAAAEVQPWNPELLQQRWDYRRKAIEAGAARAAASEREGEWETAAREWEELLVLDPRLLRAREALARIRAAQTEAWMREGDTLLAAGDCDAALELWRRAQSLAPCDALRNRLRAAEAERCMARGLEHYEAQRMAEARFQFRKVLALDPRHETAQRYLGYLEGASSDAALADRFSHLE